MIDRLLLKSKLHPGLRNALIVLWNMTGMTLAYLICWHWEEWSSQLAFGILVFMAVGACAFAVQRAYYQQEVSS